VEKPPDVNIMATAIHEAGQAVAAVHFDLGLVSVDIKPGFDVKGQPRLGYTKCLFEPVQGSPKAMAKTIQALAGSLAESDFHCDERALLMAGAGDLADAMEIAAIAICPPVIRPDGTAWIGPEVIAAHKREIDDFVLAAGQAAEDFVDRFTPSIRAVADALVVHRELSPDQVRTIMRECQPDSLPDGHHGE
jgi:hypothetical protein